MLPKSYIHPPRTRNNTIWFIVYLLCAVSIGLFIRDIPGQPSFFATIQNFMTAESIKDFGDPVSFASGALDIYQHGWIRPENQWLVRLWPPGFMVMEGAILKVWGIDAPFILILILLCSVCIALMLSVLRLNLSAVIPNAPASILPLAPFLFPVIRFWLLQPGSIVFGEAFAIVFFMTSMLLVPVAIRYRSLKWCALSGIMLALAAYFRSQFELVVTFLTLMAALMTFTYYLFFKKRISGTDQNHMGLVIKAMAIMLLVAHTIMTPWRLHNLYEPYTGNLSWVQTNTLVYANAGRTDKELIEAGGRWIVQGGGNVACKVEPSYCGKSDKAGFYQSFMYHPLDWALYKYRIVGDYWFSSLRNFALNFFQANAGDFVANLATLFFVLFNLFLLLRIRHHPDFPVYLCECLAFYAFCFGIFLFAHLETRYFYALKIYGIFTFVSLSAIAWPLATARHATSLPDHATWFQYE